MVRCCLELTVLFEVNVESEKQMCDMSRCPKSLFFLGREEDQAAVMQRGFLQATRPHKLTSNVLLRWP